MAVLPKETSMRKSLLLLVLSLLSGATALLQQGCTVYVVKGPAVPAPTPYPYPNAWHIEVRVRDQITRIKLALQGGQLDQETAYLLAQNDELVRRFSREDKGAI